MKDKASSTITLRAAGRGDWGWMLQKHGEVYAPEFGWDTDMMEAFVATALGDFIPKHRLPGYGSWIAEADGVPVGSVVVERKDAETGSLRMLLVVPEGRGMGVGKELVNECIRFSKKAGYSKLSLFTTNENLAAIKAYEKCGFKYTHSSKWTGFGPELEAMYYEIAL